NVISRNVVLTQTSEEAASSDWPRLCIVRLTAQIDRHTIYIHHHMKILNQHAVVWRVVAERELSRNGTWHIALRHDVEWVRMNLSHVYRDAPRGTVAVLCVIDVIARFRTLASNKYRRACVH